MLSHFLKKLNVYQYRQTSHLETRVFNCKPPCYDGETTTFHNLAQISDIAGPRSARLLLYDNLYNSCHTYSVEVLHNLPLSFPRRDLLTVNPAMAGYEGGQTTAEEIEGRERLYRLALGKFVLRYIGKEPRYSVN